MVCGLTRFMQDETVFPALEAMIPQFRVDIVIFGQLKKWGHWHIAARISSVSGRRWTPGNFLGSAGSG